MEASALIALLPTHCSRRTGVLDSNLLVLTVSAHVDATLLKTFKRVKGFAQEDIDLLSWLVGQFAEIVTTSYTLAEASNLANELSGYKRDLWFGALADYAKHTTEAHVPTKSVGRHRLVQRFGVTDAALSCLSRDHVLITTEYRLSGQLVEEQAGAVINFNHLRPIWMA